MHGAATGSVMGGASLMKATAKGKSVGGEVRGGGGVPDTHTFECVFCGVCFCGFLNSYL
jgi:hypothetical protein